MKISIYSKETGVGYFITGIAFKHKEAATRQSNVIMVCIETNDGEKVDEIGLDYFYKYYETNAYGYENLLRLIAMEAAKMRPWEV